MVRRTQGNHAVNRYGTLLFHIIGRQPCARCQPTHAMPHDNWCHPCGLLHLSYSTAYHAGVRINGSKCWLQIHRYKYPLLQLQTLYPVRPKRAIAKESMQQHNAALIFATYTDAQIVA